MRPLRGSIDALAGRTSFSGVVRVDRGDGPPVASAYGLADRAHGIENTVDTRFAIASGSKGFTALTVMSLVEDGALAPDTTARSLLDDDLPMIADDVTIEHLLTHRSGIGDYLDDESIEDITESMMPVPVVELDTTEAFIPVLDGHPAVFPAGSRFAYNNGGYVVLALLAERASGASFHDLVRVRVCKPAGMGDSAFLRTDELPGLAATGYLGADTPRTNVFHLPVLGNGDGGMYSTAADLHAFWSALFEGRIVPLSTVAEMVRPRSVAPDGSARYGAGVWLHASSDVVWLTDDPGVSFCSTHDPSSSATATVISNTAEGAWPLVALLDELLFS